MFRAGGGAIDARALGLFRPRAPRRRVPATQVVVRAEVVGYLGQITWSFGRIAEAPAAP